MFKKTMFAMFFALLAGAQEMAAEGFWRQLGQVVKSSMPRVEGPAARQIGFQYQGHNMAVVNGTQFWCRVIVYGTEITAVKADGRSISVPLTPGESVYDNRYWEPLSPQIPIAALCYVDPEMQSYIGAAGRPFQISSGDRASNAWVIRNEDIRKPDGQQVQSGYGVPIYPMADTRLRARKARFPREAWDATLGLQIVNNTLFAMQVRLNGEPRYEKPVLIYWI